MKPSQDSVAAYPELMQDRRAWLQCRQLRLVATSPLQVLLYVLQRLLAYVFAKGQRCLRVWRQICLVWWCRKVCQTRQKVLVLRAKRLVSASFA